MGTINPYCLVAIIEHDLKLNRPVVEVMRILSSSLLVKDTTLQVLFEHLKNDTPTMDGQSTTFYRL
jgi:hypothetical protein